MWLKNVNTVFLSTFNSSGDVKCLMCVSNKSVLCWSEVYEMTSKVFKHIKMLSMLSSHCLNSCVWWFYMRKCFLSALWNVSLYFSWLLQSVRWSASACDRLVTAIFQRLYGLQRDRTDLCAMPCVLWGMCRDGVQETDAVSIHLNVKPREFRTNVPLMLNIVSELRSLVCCRASVLYFLGEMKKCFVKKFYLSR